jgi:hypothetical protein
MGGCVWSSEREQLRWVTCIEPSRSVYPALLVPSGATRRLALRPNMRTRGHGTGFAVLDSERREVVAARGALSCGSHTLTLESLSGSRIMSCSRAFGSSNGSSGGSSGGGEEQRYTISSSTGDLVAEVAVTGGFNPVLKLLSARRHGSQQPSHQLRLCPSIVMHADQVGLVWLIEGHGRTLIGRALQTNPTVYAELDSWTLDLSPGADCALVLVMVAIASAVRLTSSPTYLAKHERQQQHSKSAGLVS